MHDDIASLGAEIVTEADAWKPPLARWHHLPQLPWLRCVPDQAPPPILDASCGLSPGQVGELTGKRSMHDTKHHSARASGAVRLGGPVLDRYLEFVESRARHMDPKAFFRVVDSPRGGDTGRCPRHPTATQPTYLLSTDVVGAVALELPGISPDADGLNVKANEFDPVIPPHATIWPVIEGELA